MIPRRRHLDGPEEKLEKGNLPIEESLALYARGVELQKAAQAVLDSAQARFEVLMVAADGTVVRQELEPEGFLRDK